MKKNQQPTPEPVPVNVVCSLCGEPWHMHTETDGEVSTLECIRLLKAKAATRPLVIDRPYPVYPFQQPIYPYRAYWTTGTTTTSPNISLSPNTGTAITVRMPSNVVLASAAQ